MNPRRILSINSWLQLCCVAVIIVCMNILSSKYFLRLDVTDDKVHSLDMSTRSLVWKLDKPLHVKSILLRNSKPSIITIVFGR